jgi:hypothetical protein
MQPTSDPIGTRINKRIIARIPSPAFGCLGVINQPIKMLVKKPTKAPATIHRANSATDRSLLLEDTGTAYHDVSQIVDPMKTASERMVAHPDITPVLG